MTCGKCSAAWRRRRCLPAQVVIVDEAGEGNGLAREFPQLNIQVTTFPRGSASAKRNRGIECVPPEIELIGFMDDDIVLDPQALAAIEDFWRSSPPGPRWSELQFGESNAGFRLALKVAAPRLAPGSV